MKELGVDVAVLGAGTAGLGAYRAAKKQGASAVLIEGGPHGTTCARVGCMPSKLLLAAAEARHDVARAHHFGVRIEGTVRVEGRAVMARVRAERDRFVGFVLRGVEAIAAENKLRGYAKFLDDHTLSVRAALSPSSPPVARVTADRVVIATGSSPAIPAPFRDFGDRLVVSDDVFEWDTLPESVAVFGPGVIGLELGQALHRLGVRVKMFGIGNIVGPLSDPAVSEVTRRIFGGEFYLDADVKVSDMDQNGDNASITYRHFDGTERTEAFQYVLVATGRRPNVIGLGLENTSLELDAHGIPVFDRGTLRCGTSHIFIAGDANNDRPLLHEAADEGQIAGRNAGAYPDVSAGQRRPPLAIVFSDPQIATVGENYSQLTQRMGQACDFVIGRVSFEDQGRSRVMLKNQGLMHLYAQRDTGRLLGAEMIGPRAEHLGHLLAWAMGQHLTIDQALNLPFYHPVVEEGLRTALRDAQQKLRGFVPDGR